MKKLVLCVAVISAMFFTSCKKDRTCTCTTTYGGVAGTADVVTYTKARKGDARAACLSSSGTDTNGGTTVAWSQACTLK